MKGVSSISRVRRAAIDQYSWGTKASISRSRSQISRTATDCTRPALNPPRTLRHNSGLILYPTSRSRIRRACWALTKLASMSRGAWSALRTASFVTSWNSIRLILELTWLRIEARCQEIASPSRSGSVAK